MLSDAIKKRFVTEFNGEPLLVCAPGRINLIGEHTDYNNGFVMPAAIDRQIVAAIGLSSEDRCRLIAADHDDTYDFDLNHLGRPGNGWPDYILGVVDQLQKWGIAVKGFNAVFGGDIPVGAGLSSSAALECAFTYGLSELLGYSLNRSTIARLAQAAENEFVGVRCGIMDQFACMHGRADSVFRLDCRSLKHEYYDLPLSDHRLVLCDTGVKHHLASSEYNTRREECEAGVAVLQQDNPDIASLRDVELKQLARRESKFDPVVFKRCKYVVEENTRVLDACAKLRQGDPAGFGRLMYESHAGLSNEYEVSCPELDYLVELARSGGRVAGARMMGGGFGGCTINLIQAGEVEAFVDGAAKTYRERFDIELKTYQVALSDGTRLL